MASHKKFEDLDLSTEEIKRIETALKDEKFRKMFVEYAEEISNPENRRRYEEEIAMLENERGMDIQFINPEPGHVLKTTVSGEKKAFINICTSDKIAKPSAKRSKYGEGKSGLHWQIPHSFSPPREDFDKAKQTCMVYDVVFHPDTYRMTTNPNFLKMVEDTAVEGIERQFDVKLDRNNIRRPKIKSKGSLPATVIRNRKDTNEVPAKIDPSDPLSSMPYPYSDKTSAEIAEEKSKQAAERAEGKAAKDSKTKSNMLKKEENGYTTPSYTIVHRSNMDLQEYRNAPDSRPTTRPRELVITIELPHCKSAAGVELDIFEDKLTLKSEKPAYMLDLKLPYQVDDENGSARFDKSKKTLIVILPVVQAEIPKMPSFINEKEEEKNIPPLIEEVPPLEESNDTVENVPSRVVQLEELVGQMDVEKKTYPVESKSYSVPEFEYSQDTETLTFVFHVRNVSDDSVSKGFPAPGDCEVRFLSLGSGGFPMHYKLFIRFGEENLVVPDQCTVDVSDRNMVLTLLKQRKSRFLWRKLQTGLDDSCLEEKVFLTSETMQTELDQLDREGERMGQTGEVSQDAQPASIHVTEMNEKKLTLKIMKQKVSFDKEEEELEGYESPLSASIEVVHSQAPPNLHGILKQRSVSESSEDHLSSSSGNSPTGSSPRDSDSSSGLKRSVSFSEHVDRTTFKTNSSVNSMKQALKCKRKRIRKREEKKKEKDGRRRRHNSSEGSSSCDEPDHRYNSELHSEEEHEDLSQQLEEAGKKVEDNGVIEEDHEDSYEGLVYGKDEGSEVQRNMNVTVKDVNKKPVYQIQSETAAKAKKGSKIAEQVKSKMEEKRSSDGNDSDDEQDSERTSHMSEKEIFKTRDEITHKDVYKTSGQTKNINSSSSDLGDKANGNSLQQMAANGNSGGITNADEENHQGITAGEKGTKFKDASFESISESSVGKGETAEAGKLSKPEVETALSWHETGSKGDLAHRTQCAFTFSNAVMFDLDID